MAQEAADPVHTRLGAGRPVRARTAALTAGSLRRLTLGLAASRVAARAVHGSMRSALPGACRAVARLLLRCGRTGLAVAGISACAFPLLIAGIRIGLSAAERARYLYYPRHWDAAARMAPAVPARGVQEGGAQYGVGGISEPTLPLRIMTYTARKGDTLSGIAEAYDLTLDTVSSLNRNWGAGVHSVAIGEEIRVPNQNGIYVTLKRALDDVCRDYDILPEMVLAANGVRAAEVKVGSTLFFPGVQHWGVEAELIAGTAFLNPILGWYWVGSPYGVRNDPFTAGVRKAHYGLDLVAPLGTPIRAAASGRVWLATEDATFGKQVLIGHDFGYSTFYGHLDRIAVYAGQQVTNQTVIGYLGGTGKVTGPHLHFELRSGGAPIDPWKRLAPRQH